MALAAYGKHPGKGDFLAHAVPVALQAPLEGWLDAVLAEAKTDLGMTWEQVWRDAPLLRFWVGEGIWGQPVAGVMATSQDRVGRRFPLVLFCAGVEAARLPAPTIGGDGGWYDGVAALLRDRLAMRDLAGPADLVQGGSVPAHDDAQPEPGPDAFWAVRPGADVAGLLADVALTDHRRAAAGRSYWWVAGDAIPTAEPDPEPEPVAADAPEVEAQADAEPAVTAPQPPEAAADIPELGAQDEPVTERPLVPPDAWEIGPLDLPEDEGSPFATGTGLSLFAAPEAVDPTAAVAPVAMAVPMAPSTPRHLCSQVWAGQGLPNGAVLAWLLRGVGGT